ncbi:unnamed protein product [Mycena citricolor]|uniref:Endo-chitosanase n=1 Tax=Mycena citricolor TaxID=2018698 RepID=A0AAD2HFS7_9AGAR|nr:unnamed protein product [Mycena citricolor]CAK5276596.1 unnamed protein product [Mycena citricolor]
MSFFSSLFVLFALAVTSIQARAVHHHHPPARPIYSPARPVHSPAPNFEADASINVAGIYAATKGSHSKVLASYPTQANRKTITSIYGDWISLPGVSAFHFMADMDIDCDGPKANCKGNRDGQSETSFGALDATKVPYFVLPERFTRENKDILKNNALGAIICNGKMFYGIYGDQDADSPEVIGEASILVGRSCFPDSTIDGNNGHPEADVAYIVFGSQVPSGVQRSSIDVNALKALGDSQVKLLQSALGL